MKNERFEETIQTLSLEELQEMSKTLSLQATRAKNNSSTSDIEKKELERKLLVIQNRITALKIRC